MVTLSLSGTVCCQPQTWKIQPKNLDSQKKILVVISLFLPCNVGQRRPGKNFYHSQKKNKNIISKIWISARSWGKHVLYLSKAWTNSWSIESPDTLLSVNTNPSGWLLASMGSSIGWLFYNWANQSNGTSDWQSLNPNQWPIEARPGKGLHWMPLLQRPPPFFPTKNLNFWKHFGAAICD